MTARYIGAALAIVGAADGAIAAHRLGDPPVLGALIVGAYFAAVGVAALLGVGRGSR